MTTLQEHIIETLGAKATIDPAQEVRTRVNFLKDFLKLSNRKGYVLGISGGQDSSLTGRLAQIAVEELQKENGSYGTESTTPVFLAMRLPYGTQADEDDAQLALDFINPDENETYNIKPSVDAFTREYDGDLSETRDPITNYAKGNVKARMRMIAQYARAGERDMLVLGSDHMAEWSMGFMTKAGDGAADVTPLSGLNKRQGKALLEELNAPERLYTKAPTADLLDGEKAGQPDETELGVTYNEIDDYLEGKSVSPEAQEVIERRYMTTEHKRQLAVAPTDTWWKN